MIRIHFTPEDLMQMRFAYRPLLEIAFSYRVLTQPVYQGPFRRWVNEAAHALHDFDMPYLSALLPAESPYFPAFLTPTPSEKSTSIEADFEELLNTPEDMVRARIFRLIEHYGDSDARQHFLIYPRAALWCLVEELREYWRRVLAPYWSRMITTLEGDVLYRARQLALDGHRPLFNGLDQVIEYTGMSQAVSGVWNRHSANAHPYDGGTSTSSAPKGVIQIDCLAIPEDVELALGGDGMQLVPTIFRGCGLMYQFAEGWQPMIAYSARGGGLWYQKAASSTRSLEVAMGAGRAAVLRVLQTPASNSEVAFRAQIAAATANQHLMRLVEAGLARSNRSGKRVYYSLTERGENLLALFDVVD